MTPSYNQGQFLEETILSVLEQNYPNLEYLILDGGSTDDSREIIKRYASHLTNWRSRPDEGQAAAIREGFEIASGDILSWLNSDDLLAPGALHHVAEAWTTHGPDVVVTGGCQVLAESTVLSPHFPGFQEDFGQPEAIPLIRLLDVAEYWLRGDFFFQPEVFFPRRAYHSIGGIDPSIHYTMDYDLWVRLALAGTRVVVVPEVLALFRQHPGQKTANWSAVHRQLVETANFYLQDDGVPLNRFRRLMLAASNRVSLHRVPRRALSFVRNALSD